MKSYRALTAALLLAGCGAQPERQVASEAAADPRESAAPEGTVRTGAPQNPVPSQAGERAPPAPAAAAPPGGTFPIRRDQPPQTSCTMDYTPVCGADGKEYGNACVARQQGVTIRKEGPC